MWEGLEGVVWPNRHYANRRTPPAPPVFPATNAQGQRICRFCNAVSPDGTKTTSASGNGALDRWVLGPVSIPSLPLNLSRVERRGTLETKQQMAVMQKHLHQQQQPSRPGVDVGTAAPPCRGRIDRYIARVPFVIRSNCRFRTLGEVELGSGVGVENGGTAAASAGRGGAAGAGRKGTPVGSGGRTTPAGRSTPVVRGRLGEAPRQEREGRRQRRKNHRWAWISRQRLGWRWTRSKRIRKLMRLRLRHWVRLLKRRLVVRAGTRRRMGMGTLRRNSWRLWTLRRRIAAAAAAMEGRVDERGGGWGLSLGCV